jgi:hypothetical protein
MNSYILKDDVRNAINYYGVRSIRVAILMERLTETYPDYIFECTYDLHGELIKATITDDKSGAHNILLCSSGLGIISEQCLLTIISKARPPEVYIDYIHPRIVSRKFLPKFFEILPESDVMKAWTYWTQSKLKIRAKELTYLCAILEYSKID